MMISSTWPAFAFKRYYSAVKASSCAALIIARAALSAPPPTDANNQNAISVAPNSIHKKQIDQPQFMSDNCIGSNRPRAFA